MNNRYGFPMKLKLTDELTLELNKDQAHSLMFSLMDYLGMGDYTKYKRIGINGIVNTPKIVKHRLVSPMTDKKVMFKGTLTYKEVDKELKEVINTSGFKETSKSSKHKTSKDVLLSDIKLQTKSAVKKCKEYLNKYPSDFIRKKYDIIMGILDDFYVTPNEIKKYHPQGSEEILNIICGLAEIKEGSKNKGGINKKPKSDRPPAPTPQKKENDSALNTSDDINMLLDKLHKSNWNIFELLKNSSDEELKALNEKGGIGLGVAACGVSNAARASKKNDLFSKCKTLGDMFNYPEDDLLKRYQDKVMKEFKEELNTVTEAIANDLGISINLDNNEDDSNTTLKVYVDGEKVIDPALQQEVIEKVSETYNLFLDQFGSSEKVHVTSPLDFYK